MDFLQALQNESNLTRTENGAVAFKSTQSHVLDFFSKGGAYRTRSEQDIIQLFSNAFCENAELALKTLFYLRDIRGGQGERRLFRTVLTFLGDNYSDVMIKNISLIPEYGRWDDLYSLFGTKCEEAALKLIKAQLLEDVKTETPSLLAKWMKSENASSKEGKRLARKTIKFLDLSSKVYRKMLSDLRRKIKIVETQLSNKEYKNIDYSKLPSKASMQYRKAFYRNDELRYQMYLDSLTGGFTSVNADTLYPYEIVEKLFGRYPGAYGHRVSSQEQQLLNAMWEALPNYLEEGERALAVVDTSGSMSGRPIQVALSLGIYFAERNVGEFKDTFITFSFKPNLVKLNGSNLSEKIRNINMNDWSMNTNLEATFDLILNAAIKNNMSDDELPTKLYIISDMEFDRCATNHNDVSLMQHIERKFKAHGYTMPGLVFWNVNSRNDQTPARVNDMGVQLISGCSPSIFKYAMSKEIVTPYDLMLEVLNSERYEKVVI